MPELPGNFPTHCQPNHQALSCSARQLALANPQKFVCPAVSPTSNWGLQASEIHSYPHHQRHSHLPPWHVGLPKSYTA